MGEQVSVSYAGMKAVRALLRDQSAAVSAVDDYLRAAGAYESSCFDKGILSAFSGSYDAATDDIFASVSAARSSSVRIVERIKDAEDDLRAIDVRVTQKMIKLTEAQEDLIPPSVGTAGSYLKIGSAEPEPDPAPKHRRDVGPKSAAGLIDAADAAAGIRNHTGRILDGLGTQGEIDEYLEDHDE